MSGIYHNVQVSPIEDHDILLETGESLAYSDFESDPFRHPADQPDFVPNTELQAPFVTTPLASSNKAGARKNRLVAIDLLRGLIMIIMAWDHTKDLTSDGSLPVHGGNEVWNGPYSDYDNNGLIFLSRWISHFCAPGFFLLMGMGIALFHHSRSQRGWTNAQVVRHFVTRGLVLIVCDRFVNMAYYALLVRPGSWRLNQGAPPPGWATGLLSVFEVMTALGLTMIAIGCLLPLLQLLRPIRLFRGVVDCGQALCVVLSIGLYALSNALIVHYQRGDPADPLEAFPAAGAVANTFPTVLARFMVFPGLYSRGTIGYPLLPWLCIALLGLAWGYDLTSTKGKQRLARVSALVGVSFLVLFIILRQWGGVVGNYRGAPRGDLSGINVVIAFLDVCKYPPSPCYSLLTLGVDTLLLSLFAFASDQAKRYYERSEAVMQETQFSSIVATGRSCCSVLCCVSADLTFSTDDTADEDELIGCGSVPRTLSEILLVYGRVPLCYYMLQWWCLGVIGAVMHTFSDGVYLPYCILIWIGLVIALYYPCKWYGRFKESTDQSSLWRLF